MTDDDVRGWTGSPSTLLRWRVLRALVTSHGDGRFVTAFALGDQLGVDARSVGHAFQELANAELAGVADKDLAHDFHTDARPTPRGATEVERWTAATRSVVIAACTSAVLSWMDTLTSAQSATFRAFMADTRSHFFGEPFHVRVVDEAVTQLRELQLISTPSPHWKTRITGELTTTGRLVLRRFAGDLDAWQDSLTHAGSGISVWNSTGVNVAQNSPHAHQVSVISQEARAQLVTLADAAEQLMPLLQLATEEEAAGRRHATELREIASDPNSSPSKGRQVVTALRDIGINATGSATGSALVALATQVLSSLPIG